MSEFKSIVCPLDLSENSKQALTFASQLCSANKAKLFILFVGDPPLPREAMYASDEMDARIEEEQAILNEIMPTISGVEYEHVFLRGDAAEEIVKYSRESSCDLIVLSTHGRSGLMRFIMGSVCESVVRHAECPVVSIRIPKSESEMSDEEAEKGVSKS